MTATINECAKTQGRICPDNEGDTHLFVDPHAVQEISKGSTKVQKQLQEEASTKRSAVAFAKFFTKRQPFKSETLSTSSGGGASEETSITQSDFDRVFRPFVLKKNMTVAPINWFAKRRKDMIIIDAEDCQVKTSLSPGGQYKEMKLI
jgi:chromatin assembly factor 1 subunit A